MAMERTLVLIKPDALKRKLTGLVLDRLEHAGLDIVGVKLVRLTEELVREHYKTLRDKPYYENAVKFLTGRLSGMECPKSFAFIYQGDDAIARVRDIAGATNPEEAEPCTLRGSFGRIHHEGYYENVIHASSDPKEAEREIAVWFKKEEVLK